VKDWTYAEARAHREVNPIAMPMTSESRDTLQRLGFDLHEASDEELRRFGPATPHLEVDLRNAPNWTRADLERIAATIERDAKSAMPWSDRTGSMRPSLQTSVTAPSRCQMTAWQRWCFNLGFAVAAIRSAAGATADLIRFMTGRHEDWR
jgi:hypothetical protein